MPDYTQTHVVPTEGLPAWAGPDGPSAPAGSLDPGPRRWCRARPAPWPHQAGSGAGTGGFLVAFVSVVGIVFAIVPFIAIVGAVITAAGGVLTLARKKS